MESQGPQGDGAIDLPRLISAVAAKKWWVIIPTLAAFGAGLVFVTVTSPRYMAAAKVTLENQETYFTRPEKAATELSTPSVYDPEGVQSEAETVATQDLARKAVDKLGLMKDPEFNPASHNPLSILFSALGGRADADPEDRVAETFLSRLTVYPLAKSRVLQFEFTSSNPELAANGANTAAELYLAAKEDARKNATRADAVWLSNAIDKLRLRVAEADDKFEAYRGQNGLLAGANGMTVPTQQLAEINAQIATARAAQTAASSKAQMLRQMLKAGRLDAVPDVAKDDSLRHYAEARVTLKAQIAEQSRTLLPGHPRMQELNGQLAGLEAEMRAAAIKVVSGLEDESHLAGAQVESLEAAVAKQSKTVAASSGDEVRLRALELDAKTAREQLESYIEKYHEAISHDADNAQPPNARITSKAVAPRTPVFPKKGPTLLLTTLAGLFISAGAVIARALLAETPKAEAAGRSAPESGREDPAFGTQTPPAYAADALASSTGPIEAFIDTLAELAEPGSCIPILVAAEGSKGALPVALTAARRLSARGRTALLDLGATQPWLADTFDRDVDQGAAHMGLSDLIDGGATFAQVVHRDLSSPLDILPAGAGEIVPEALEPVLDAFAENYDFLVIHASDWRAGSAEAVIGAVAAVMLCAPVAHLPAAQERLRQGLLQLSADPSIVVRGVATPTLRGRSRAA